MKKYLVTGFEAFDGQKINPTQVLVENFQKDSQWSDGFDFKVLPVTYQKSFEMIQRMPLSSYDGIIMLGQASTRSKICFERVALNWIENTKPDNDGVQRPSGKIIDSPDAELAIFTEAPIDEWVSIMDKYFPGKQSVSLSAGGFVCNYLYYRVARHLMGQSSWKIFIHVPSSEASSDDSMPIDQQTKWLETFLKKAIIC